MESASLSRDGAFISSDELTSSGTICECLVMPDVLFVRLATSIGRHRPHCCFAGSWVTMRGIEVTEHSAGHAGGQHRPPSPLVEERRAVGVDPGGHLPRIVDVGMIQAADIVVGLTPEHVRETVVAVPTSLPRLSPGTNTIAMRSWFMHLSRSVGGTACPAEVPPIA